MKADSKNILTEEIERLQARNRKLADEKSHLQLVIGLVERLNPLSGLDELLRGLLHNIVDAIGGTNIKLYYWIDDELHYIDFLGAHMTLENLDDPVVAKVCEKHLFVEISEKTEQALLHGAVIPSVWTWAFPLLVGQQLIGVIKLENLHIGAAPLRKYLPIFFNHAALILSNEISNYKRRQTEKSLLEKTEELDSYFNNALELFCIADTQGHFRKLNREWEHVLGYTRSELEGSSFREFIHPDDLPAALDALSKLRAQNAVLNFVNRFRRKDGAYRWIEWRAHPQGELIYAAARDITERKQAEDNLKLAANVFVHAREGITITDVNGTIVDVNETFSRITGYSREEAIGKNPRILKSGRQGAEFYTAMWKTLVEKGHWTGEIWNRRKNGEVYAEMLTISSVKDSTGKPQSYVALFNDITQSIEHQQQLEHIAHYDALTNLPNRALLADRMSQAIAQTRREQGLMGLCYLDLDGFKTINDTMGHAAGDQVLIEVSQRILATIRGGDTVARLGGDEFVVLLLGLEKGEECVATLERLLSSISIPVTIAGKSVAVSVSIGVSIYPLDDEDADTLLRHADQAMYQAKQAGKNRFHIFDPMLDQRARSHHEFMHSVQRALEKNEFVLYYQPKVNLQSGQLVGAEALIRWQHPEKGLLPPAEFLHAIDNTDLDIALGEWVINRALVQIQQWRFAGLDLEVSINISAFHLESANFVKRLKQKIAQFPDMPAGRLQIEVLETAALDDIAVVNEIISECHEFGVRFALDDFGTGYSSLTYLSHLPVDTLKIDQSFVRDMLEDKGDMAIVHGIIALARAFDRQTVAEGIETESHYQALLDMGCEIGQGYGIARPMPADELAIWHMKLSKR